MFNNVWLDNIEASRRRNQEIECVPAEYIALMTLPLASGRIEPDVCVLYMNSAQAFMLYAGGQHHQYEKLRLTVETVVSNVFIA